MPTRDIRVEVKVRNNLILRMMEGKRIETVSELSTLIGKPNQPGHLGDLINMKTPARNSDGSWRQMAIALATFFRCLPEDLFNDFQQTERLEKNRAHAEIAFGDIQSAIAAQQTPEIALQRTELIATVKEALGKLTAREERVLRLRFGIDAVESTFEEVGRQLGVNRERVRQIEARALRKLRHPSYNRKLREASEVEKGFLDGNLM